MYIYYTQAQHMACKSVPVSLIVLSFVIYSNQSPNTTFNKSLQGMVPSTQIVMRQLFQELYALFPEIVQGSICFENDGEPHLCVSCLVYVCIVLFCAYPLINSSYRIVLLFRISE